MIIDMKKQTAVDQLRERLFKEFGFAYSDNIHEELKAIEKEQISEAYRTGVEEDVYKNRLRTGEMYYNQTFKR